MGDAASAAGTAATRPGSFSSGTTMVRSTARRPATINSISSPAGAGGLAHGSEATGGPRRGSRPDTPLPASPPTRVPPPQEGGAGGSPPGGNGGPAGKGNGGSSGTAFKG